MVLAAGLTLTPQAGAAAPPPLPRPYWRLPKTHIGMQARLALSADGKLLAVLGYCDDRESWTLKVWDTAAKKLLFQTPPRTIGRNAFGLAFTPGGKKVVAVTAGPSRNPRPDNTWVAHVRVICPHTGFVAKEFELPPTRGRVSAVSPDGKKLVVGGDGMAFSVYDLETTFEIDRLTGPEPQPITNFPLLFDNAEEHQARMDNRVSLLEFSPDGKFVAVGTTGGWVSLWNLGQRACLWRRRILRTQVKSLSFSPDGKVLASVAGPLTLFRVSNNQGNPVTKERLGGIWVYFMGDGKTLMLASGSSRAGFIGWDSSERRVLGESWRASDDPRKARLQVPDFLQSAISADRSFLATERAPNHVEVWDLRNVWPR
jgi:WD40 repeat protein